MPRSPPSLLCAAGLMLLAAPQAAGDLGAALRRSSATQQGPTALPAAAPLLSGAIVVPLQRVAARSGGVDASFFLGTVSVGHPAQELQVLFDTSSGHVLLPHRACKTAACVEHRRYSPWESSTAMDVNVDGSPVQEGRRFAQGSGTRDGLTLGYTQSDLGEGDAKAVLVRDSICLGPAAHGEACVDMALLAATSLEEKPFRAMPNDGIIGLGLESLAAGPICSFLDRLLDGGSRSVLPQFGIALGADRGEIHLGSHDQARLAAPLRWFPVDHPEAGYWQVAIRAVLVGNITVNDCKRGCHGIVDTGVSRLGVQASHLPVLIAALKPNPSQQGQCQGPDLTFDLGDMALTLKAKDYAGANCTVQLGSLNLDEPQFTGVYAFGTNVLQSYYAAFDWEQRKLGFAPLAAASKPPMDSEPQLIVV